MKQVSCENIFGYPISRAGLNECIARILHWIEGGSKRKWFVCANPHSLEVARRDQIFDEAIRNADLVVPDGIGIVFASWMLGGAIRKRVTGSDVFWALSHALNQKGAFRVFFLGSSDKTLAKIGEKMRYDFPNLQVVGTYSPPFKPNFTNEESGLMIETINRAKPDILWVGMTAPKQEKWVYMNRDALDVKFIGPIGAVFDFCAGTIKRSHPWFRAHGLEWLPRLTRDPKRLWRRNLISNPLFMLRVVRYRLGQRTGQL